MTAEREEWKAETLRLRAANDAFQDQAEALREEIDARTKERDEARAERDAHRALAVFVARLDTGRAMHPSSNLSALDIAVANAGGRMFVTADGMGYVIVDLPALARLSGGK